MTDSDSVRPLACPWCGTPPAVEPAIIGNSSYWTVACEGTEERGCDHYPIVFSGKSEAEAIAAWNRRPSPPGEAASAVVSDAALLNAVVFAVLSCPHEITGREIVLHQSREAEGNAMAQLRERIRAALSHATARKEAGHE